MRLPWCQITNKFRVYLLLQIQNTVPGSCFFRFPDHGPWVTVHGSRTTVPFHPCESMANKIGLGWQSVTCHIYGRTHLCNMTQFDITHSHVICHILVQLSCVIFNNKWHKMAQFYYLTAKYALRLYSYGILFDISFFRFYKVLIKNKITFSGKYYRETWTLEDQQKFSCICIYNKMRENTDIFDIFRWNYAFINTSNVIQS